MKETKLNNLLSMEEYSEKDVFKKSKATKRTDVAKDVLMESEVTGKDVNTEKMKDKEVVVSKELNNLFSIDDFSKEMTAEPKKSKKTEVAKDILEKKEECCDEDEKEEEEEKPKGLTAAQKKLPEALQKAILKRQKK